MRFGSWFSVLGSRAAVQRKHPLALAGMIDDWRWVIAPDLDLRALLLSCGHGPGRMDIAIGHVR
jgi:hypothetical protein